MKHRKTIRFNIGRYLTAVERGKTQFSYYQEARTIANSIKNEVLSNFSDMLNQFEKTALYGAVLQKIFLQGMKGFSVRQSFNGNDFCAVCLWN